MTKKIKVKIKDDMTYLEFLQTVKVLKMLYGAQIAQKFFEENIGSWYNVTNASFLNAERNKE